MSLLKKIKGSSFWKSVASLSAGQIIGQIITLVSTPIVSRLYSTEQYGNYGIITSTATIIIGIIGLGLTSSVMVAKTDEEANKTVGVTFLMQIILATLLCGGMLVISPYHHFFETSVSYIAALILMLVYIICQSLMAILSVYINRLGKNKVLFFNPLINAICTLIITIPCGLLKFDFIGLMIAAILGSFLSCMHMLRAENPFKTKLSLRTIWDVLKANKKFVFFQYPSNLLSTFSAQMPNQTLAGNFGNAALGGYSMCTRLFNFPLHLIATPIQTVYFRTASAKYRNNEDIAPLTFSLVSKICLVAFVPMLIVIMFGKSIFSFVLGSSWGIAGEIASILVLQYIFCFCNNCITYCRVSIGKQKINLYAALIQLSLIGLSLWLGLKLTGTLLGVITFFGIFNAIWQIIDIEISFICLKKYYVKWLVFAVVYAVIAMLCYLLIHNLF